MAVQRFHCSAKLLGGPPVDRALNRNPLGTFWLAPLMRAAHDSNPYRIADSGKERVRILQLCGSCPCRYQDCENKECKSPPRPSKTKARMRPPLLCPPKHDPWNRVSRICWAPGRIRVRGKYTANGVRNRGRPGFDLPRIIRAGLVTNWPGRGHSFQSLICLGPPPRA